MKANVSEGERNGVIKLSIKGKMSDGERVIRLSIKVKASEGGRGNRAVNEDEGVGRGKG